MTGSDVDPFSTGAGLNALLNLSTGDQDNFVRFAADAGSGGGVGLRLLVEEGGATTADVFTADAAVAGDAVDLDLFLEFDVDNAAAGRVPVAAFYDIGGGPLIPAGTTTVPEAWFAGPDAVAMGLISTSNGTGVTGTASPFTVGWESFSAYTQSADDVVNASAVTRINVGGPTISAIDAGPSWLGDTLASPSPFLVAGSTDLIDVSPNQVTPDVTVPLSTPVSGPGGDTSGNVFHSARWDTFAAPPLTYAIPVSAGPTVTVRLYFAELFWNAPGIRAFNVSVEGQTMLSEFDIFDETGAAFVGTMREITVLNDGVIDIIASHGPLNNPSLAAIEIVDG